VKGFASREEMRPWVPRVTRAYEEAFRDLPEFFPLSEGELRLMADDLISAADPRLLKLVMKGDDVAGFVFAYPDVAVALQRTRGRLFPLGWLWLLREQRRSEWAVVNGIGLLPAYRGVGGDVLLLTELERSLRARAFKHVDAVMVGEDNDASRANLEKLGVRWYKRHRSYRRRL
jgi:ribosomal protein S18 acetylase RimI-like enzyme